MLKEELKEIINSLKDIKSDTTHVEIKSCEGGFPKRIWETISAFANASGGGIIILGISETEKGISITGLKEPAKFHKDLAAICSQMMPPLRPLIEVHKIEDKFIVTAEIPEVSYKEKPCYYHGAGIMSGSFIRFSDGDRKLTQYEVQGFLDGRGQPLYDVEIVPGSSINDLDKELVKLFVGKVKQKLPKVGSWNEKKILHTYRVLSESKGEEFVTLAGMLCLGSYPQKYFPGLSIHVLVYPETDEGKIGSFGERLIDNIKVEGALVRAVPEVIKAIKRNLQKRTIVKGMFREDVLEYPEIFLREAVINAIGHRDYSPLARGSATQIKIFPNRVEIINPGGLFGPVTEERLGEHGLQATRNSHLMKLLEDMPVPGEKHVLCENRGTGIPSMIHALIKAGMEPPQFRDLRNQFRVSCFNHALFDKETLSWLEKYAHLSLTEKQRFALAYIRHNEKLNNFDYCRINDCDSRVATKELTGLVESGLIIQHGSGRWTFYTIKNTKKLEIGEETKKEIKKKDRREEIISIIKNHGEMSREEIKNKIQMSTPTVLYWLRRLIKDKVIKPTTRSTKDRNVKYRLRDD